MSAKEVRQQFLDFFTSKDHEIVESSPVVPPQDDLSLKDTFTNAGMNQFKDVFLATGSRAYTRAADTQKCIRAGGKHNDLDDVGQDTYHHTFFEMLGNWSFGDYFKKEAIEWAWELLTGVWGIDKARLHATYFEGDESEGLKPDTEAAELWRSVTDIDPSHIHPGDKKDNFWEMGDTGPCGPCSEIHIDLTADLSGGPLVNAGDARVIELWNLVFIQFNRGADRKLTPLPAKHVDTGMGFERLCAVLVGMQTGRLAQTSNYDTDVFTPIFEAIQKRTGAPKYAGTLPGDEQTPPSEPRASARAESRASDSPRGLKPAARSEDTHDQIMIDVSYRVIADHVRCLTFALTDGAEPSNEGRGYVLRRILRRAVRYGRQYFNMHEPFLCDLVEPLVKHMVGAFPELQTAHGGSNVAHVTELIRGEEDSFMKTIERGLRRFDDAVVEAVSHAIARTQGWNVVTTTTEAFAIHNDDDEPTPGQEWVVCFSDQDGNDHRISIDPRNPSELHPYWSNAPSIGGNHAFRLHDTYGFPIDLTVLMAEELALVVDVGEYERLMDEARGKARAASKMDWLPRYAGNEAAEAYQHSDGTPPHLSGTHATEPIYTGTPEERGPTDDSFKYRERSIEAKVRCFITFVADGRAALFNDSEIGKGRKAGVVLDRTCFYGEQGGQVGDSGMIETASARFRVEKTNRMKETVVHWGTLLSGKLCLGEDVKASVDPARRPTMKNHTATHMLNWALREVLGERVQQKGSLVDPEKTRFDLTHNKPVTHDELVRIEELVNERIEAAQPVHTKEVEEKKAREINTLRAVFGEKYPEIVRVVSIGADIDEMLKDPTNEKWMQYPVEFCGGTHLKNTSEAECFVLTTEEGVAKGVRRVVGITGEAARGAVETGKTLLAEVEALSTGGKPVPHADPSRGLQPARSHDSLGAALSAFRRKVNEAVISVTVRHELHERIAELQKIAKKQEKQAASDAGGAVMERAASLLAEAQTIAGVTVVVGDVPAAPPDSLRSAIDWIRNKTDASAVVLAMVADDRVTLIAGMSKIVVSRGIKAGDLIKEVAPLVGGKGGGRPDMAQGGGNDPTGVPSALDRARVWVGEKLA